jgi:hypothetical protein
MKLINPAAKDKNLAKGHNPKMKRIKPDNLGGEGKENSKKITSAIEILSSVKITQKGRNIRRICPL